MSDYICKELIFEIFTRLPPKSLLRFRAVSKALCSIISSPGFISMHTSRSPQKLLIKHQNSDTKEFCTLHSEDQLPLCPDRRYRGITQLEFSDNKYDNVVGSSNGILCLVDYGNVISLWNPSIRRKLILPDCPWKSFPLEAVGFGFDPIIDDYKIVSMPRYGGLFGDCSFAVYTLKKGVWCAIASHAPLFSYVSSNACFVSEALHWIVRRYRTEESEDSIDFRHIMTFDLSTHVFGTIEIPEPSWEKRELTTIQGSLAMISTEGGDSRIWLWRDASWTIVFELKLNKGEGGVKRVLHLTSNGDLLFNTCSVGFQVYNLKTRKRSRLVNFKAYSCIHDIVLYVESLQLLDMGNFGS